MSDEAIFDAHCLALGRLCIAWAELNRNVTNLVSVLIGQGPEVTACIFPGSENMKPRCESVKKLVAYTAPGGEPAWQQGLSALMNRILNDLAARRNRYVHDEWLGDQGDVVRYDATTRVRHPKAGDDRTVTFGSWHPNDAPQVNNLTVELRQLSQHLMLIVIKLAMLESEKRPLGPFPQLP